MADFQQTCKLFKIQQGSSLPHYLMNLMPFVEESFGDYLIRHNLEYSIDAVEAWLTEISHKRSSLHKLYCRRLQGKIALLAFDHDDVEKRLLSRRHDTEITDLELPSSFEDVINLYIASSDFNNLSSFTKRTGLFCIRKFLKFQLSRGIGAVENISTRDILEYRKAFPHYCQLLNEFTPFLLKSTHFVFYAHYDLKDVHVRKIALCVPLSTMKFAGPFITVREFASIMDEIYRISLEIGYSPNSLQSCLRAKFSLGFFMETFGLSFSEALAKAWCEKLKDELNIRMRDEMTFYNIACEIVFRGVNLTESIISRFRKYREKMKLPSWMNKAYEDYKRFRKENHLSSSTLSFDRIALVRFGKYADNKGCRSLSDLTPELLKAYNIDDTDHVSAAAKQAFNIRIKNFLKYLGEQEIVDAKLWRAMPSGHVPKERPVTILSNEQVDRLLNYCRGPKPSNRISFYRDAAVVMLMLFTGLRLSDAISLRFDELKLDTMELIKIQQKTNTAVHLPLTNTVLNALFRYLEYERPKYDSPFVFLTSCAPFKFPKNIQLSDFLISASGVKCNSHILRKTFASMLLNKAALSAEMISIMLGHRDLHNIHKYLDQNDMTLRLCAITLSGIEYSGGLYGR